MRDKYDLLVRDVTCHHNDCQIKGHGSCDTARPISPRLTGAKNWLSRYTTRWHACALTAIALTSVFFILFNCLDAHNLKRQIFCCDHKVSDINYLGPVSVMAYHVRAIHNSRL